MSFARNRREPVKEVDTNIWSCTSNECEGWMREAFSFSEVPTCPLCQAEMLEEIKSLPELK